MIGVVVSLKVLGEDRATRDGVVRGGSNSASSPDFRGG